MKRGDGKGAGGRGTGGSRQEAEGSRQKAVSRRQKAVGRRQGSGGHGSASHQFLLGFALCSQFVERLAPISFFLPEAMEFRE